MTWYVLYYFSATVCLITRIQWGLWTTQTCLNFHTNNKTSCKLHRKQPWLSLAQEPREMFKDQLYCSYLLNVTEAPPQTLIIMICKSVSAWDCQEINKTTKTQQILQASNQELVLCNFWRNPALFLDTCHAWEWATDSVLRDTALEPQLRQQISIPVQLASRHLAEAQHSCRICCLGNGSLCPPKCTEE